MRVEFLLKKKRKSSLNCIVSHRLIIPFQVLAWRLVRLPMEGRNWKTARCAVKPKFHYRFDNNCVQMVCNSLSSPSSIVYVTMVWQHLQFFCVFTMCPNVFANQCAFIAETLIPLLNNSILCSFVVNSRWFVQKTVKQFRRL